MQLRTIALALAISSGAFAADSCPVTKPPNPPFVPPKPFPEADRGTFYVGTPKLWVRVYVHPDGVWRGLPLWPEGYREKIVWFSEGYIAKADPQPAIEISGRRLDAKAPPLVVTGANGSWTSVDFIMSGVNFPTVGCWEIAGRFRGAEVKFVVQVE
jgi:hypothetical protein